MAGLKDVENRTWRTNYRGRLVIHAGSHDDRQAALRHADLLGSHQTTREGTCVPSWAYTAPLAHLPGGALLGTVELVDCVRDSASEWAIDGLWHWQIADPQPFEMPIPVKGKLGVCVYFGSLAVRTSLGDREGACDGSGAATDRYPSGPRASG